MTPSVASPQPASVPGRLASLASRGGYLWLLFLLLIPALLPLLRPGFFVSDDGRFHVYRIAALAGAWEQGVLHPRLFPEFGFGYGQAVLNFYSPLSYWPGALLAVFGLGPATAAQVTIALGFLLAALAAYGYARYLAGPLAGLLAAVAYTYLPYHLADAYVRGAIPEHMAFIFPPLILWAYTAAFRERDPWSPLLWGALAWAGLVLTHNLSSLLVAAVAALHLLLMAVWTGRWRRLVGAAGSLLLALGLTATYWLPVLVESSAVGISGEPSRGYAGHLLAAGDLLLRRLAYLYRAQNGFGLVYPLSWLTAGLLVLSAALLVWRWRQKRLPQAAPAFVFHVAIAAGAAFMLTGPSLPLWDLSQPALGHLQYPWRFLLLVNVGLLGAVASLPALAPRVHPLAWIAGLSLAVMAVALPGLPVEPLALPAADTWAPDRMWQEDAQAGQVGATWTAEFLPLAVTEQRWALGRPREGATDGPPLQPVPQVVLAGRQYAGLTADVDAGAGFALRLHQFQQPGWNARIDGVPVPTYASGEMALVTVDVPAGNHRVTLAFGATPARTAGAILSTLAVLAWALLAWWRSGSRRSLRAGAVVLLLVAGLLLLNGLGVGRRTWVPYPAQTTLSTREGQPAPAAVLVGRDVAPARGANALDVTLYWLALRENGRDYQAFVHLTGPDGAVIAQHDGDPVGGFTPTTRWRSGELIADRHRIALPDDLPPGSYGLKAGLYALDEAGPRNLATDPATPDDRVELGSVALP